MGITAGSALFLVTVVQVAFLPRALPLGLLEHYFPFYSATWSGAVVGLLWGGACGYAAGWLLAFVHNLAVDFWLVVVRTKSDLTQRRDILDHLR